jgi:curved DNA-binding protein CbpA
MSIEPDPYRVLGLARGASADEVRRAYRRLVKENHPDSAGEKALPRFLAIQAAYETLAGGPSTRQVGGRPATRPTPRDPWRADPDRARTTRDTSGRAGRAGWGSSPGAGPGGAASTGSAAEPGATSSSGEPRRRSRPTSAGGPGAKNSTGTAGSSTGRGGDSVGSSQRPGGDRSRRDGRKRAPNKATLGSTSYDAAEDEPFEPEWSGGTWYGASSGTYWTLNPKEYADPRKHGPEYQRRARRRAGGSNVGGTGRLTDEPWDEDSAERDESPLSSPDDADSTSTDRASADWATRRPPAGRRGEPSKPPAPRYPRDTSRPRSTPVSEGGSSAWDAAAGSAASSEPSDGLDPFEAAAHAAMSLAGTPRGFMARVVLALIGWPAIGLALTTITGELTGCGRFAASCVDPFGVGTWLAQLVIIAILLFLPSVAALSAVGSLVALAASVPTAVILSASGGSREPAVSATILGVVLALAYAAGVVVALVRRRRIAPLP